MNTRVRAVIDSYTVSFKRRRSGRLLNIAVDAGGVSEASRKAREYVAERYPHSGYSEYGISRTTVVEAAVVSWGSKGREERWYPTRMTRGKLQLAPAYWMLPSTA